jgi:chromosome segregation ATPase
MDERKRTINELEFKKRELERSQGLLHEDFGGTLFNRFAGRETLLGDIAQEYLALQKNIADSQELIRLTEADVTRLNDLGAEIHAKERDDAVLRAEIPAAAADVGRDAVGEERFSAILGIFQDRVAEIAPKLDEISGKLDELDGNAAPGFFKWVDKNTRGAMYRTMAARHRGNLEKIYAAAGEKLAAPENEPLVSGHELEEAVRVLRDLKEGAAARTRELEELRAEHRRLGSAFGAEGGPYRRIQNLEKRIAGSRQELRALQRRLGEQISAGAEEFERILEPEDRRVIEMSGRNRETIAEYDRSIEKLKTSLMIDEKKAEIEKMKRVQADQERRIADAEERIRAIKAQIDETEAHIEELSKLL